jgi:hypothetical protein
LRTRQEHWRACIEGHVALTFFFGYIFHVALTALRPLWHITVRSLSPQSYFCTASSLLWPERLDSVFL